MSLNTTSILLTQGKFALIDDGDLEKVSSINKHGNNLINTNLRRNNKSGVTGVSWSEGRKKWVVQFGRRNFKKRFNTFEEAVKARKEVERVHIYN